MAGSLKAEQEVPPPPAALKQRAWGRCKQLLLGPTLAGAARSVRHHRQPGAVLCCAVLPCCPTCRLAPGVHLKNTKRPSLSKLVHMNTQERWACQYNSKLA
jgi:hypothetical protein